MPWSACQLNIKNVNNNGVLITGQAVEGLFTIVFEKKNVMLKYIKCKIIGTYKANWSRPMPTIPFIRSYAAKEKIIDIILDVFPEYRDVSLVAGAIVKKEFSFYLPENIPSSFKGSLGKVKYFIELEAKGNKKVKKKHTFALTVHQKSLINDVNNLLVSTEYRFHKCTLFNGKIAFVLKTLKSFSPPQIVPFSLAIKIGKSVKINKVKVALVQLVRYKSNSGYADIEKHIINVEELIQSKCNQISNHFLMDASLNNIVPTSNRSSSLEIDYLLEIKYEFHIEFVLPFHFNLFEKIPVIVLSS